jgi:acyl-CoA synthetase (AMP-forming)/AMP-acid ligase II
MAQALPPEVAVPPEVPLPQILQRRAALSPARRAYVFLGEHGDEQAALTDGELHERARATAAELAARCAPGDRALLLFPPGLDFIVAFFACLYAGVVAVPVNPPRQGRLAAAASSIAADCEPAAVLGPAALLDEAKTVLPPAGQRGAGATWLPVGGPLAGGAEGGRTVPAFRPGPPAPDSIAFLQYTSGSTAVPKGVMVSHGNLLANEAMIAAAFGHDQDSTVVGWAPFFHDQGLIGNVLQPMYVGATCVLMSPMTFARRPLRWLEAISRYRAHTSGGPNFAFDACVARAARGDLPALDLSSWRVAFNGAEPIRPETLRQFTETFAPYGFAAEAMYPCYGLAEATLLVTGSRKGRGPRTLQADAGELGRERYVPASPGHGSAPGQGSPPGRGRTLAGSGLALPGEDVRVVDPATGLPCAADRVGEIWVAGPHVARGYWRREDATAATFRAQCPDAPGRPYLRTGDLGFLADGELYVVGRLKDLVIIRGRNYYPQDIEDTVSSAHRALRPGGCAAFAVPKAAGGEQLVVIQEVKPDAAALAGPGDITGAIRAAVIRDHQIALGDLVLTRPGQLPKTSSGKIMRAAARERYLAAGFLAWPPARAESVPA